jgi:nucleoside 2-deoxyribosyltransferase
MRVYLAGSITGLTVDKALGWRQIAKEKLKEHGIDAYSPMRGKSDIASANETILIDSESKKGGPESTNKAIMTRDFIDCVRADAILANLSDIPNIISGGTCMEFGFAYARQIPIIAIVQADSYYMRHPMMYEAINYRVDTLDQGIEVVLSLLLP